MSSAEEDDPGPPRADLDNLWEKWADQGLLDEGIEQEGFTSFRGGTVRTVDDGG